MSRRALRRAALLVGALLLATYALVVASASYGVEEFGYVPSPPNGLPWAPMRGFTWEQLWAHAARAALLGPALLLLGSALRPRRSLEVLALEPSRRWVRLAALGAGLLTALVTVLVLRGSPITTDELAYAFQAAVLRQGRLSPEPLGFAPAEAASVPALASYSTKYLPGEGVVQLLGERLGYPALLHAPLVTLTVLAFHRALGAYLRPRAAVLSAAALALAPAFTLTSATGLSHATALCLVALAGLGLEGCRGASPKLGGLLVGAALGACLWVRPQVAAPVGAVLAPWALARLLLRREPGAALLLVLAGLGFTAGIAAYDAALFGEPLRLPWFAQCDAERYGWGRVWVSSSFEHTPRVALENLGVVAVRANGWWLGLPLGLLLVPLWWHLGRPGAEARPWFAVALAIVLFQAGYYSPGVSDTGFVYHLELLFALSIIAGGTLDAAWLRWGGRALIVAFTQLTLGTGTFYAEHLARLWRLRHAIHDDADRALASVERPALVLHEDWSSELRYVGWLTDSFPRRYRAPTDPIVTFPRPVPSRLQRVLDAYPGRHCYYYHRLNATGAAELLPCEHARAFLARPALEPEYRRAPWIAPTSYRRTAYDPFQLQRGLMLRGADGQPLGACCPQLGPLDDQARIEAARPCLER